MKHDLTNGVRTPFRNYVLGLILFVSISIPISQSLEKAMLVSPTETKSGSSLCTVYRQDVSVTDSQARLIEELQLFHHLIAIEYRDRTGGFVAPEIFSIDQHACKVSDQDKAPNTFESGLRNARLKIVRDTLQLLGSSSVVEITSLVYKDGFEIVKLTRESKSGFGNDSIVLKIKRINGRWMVCSTVYKRE